MSGNWSNPTKFRLRLGRNMRQSQKLPSELEKLDAVLRGLLCEIFRKFILWLRDVEIWLHLIFGNYWKTFLKLNSIINYHIVTINHTN